MKGTYIKTKIFRKTVPALTLVMMALAMGIEVNETEALAFTNTTKEVSIGIEVDTPVKPDVEKVVEKALAEKSTNSFWDWVEDGGSVSNDGSSNDGSSSEETSSPEDTSSPTETPTSTPVATPVVTPTPTYKPSDLDVVTKEELTIGGVNVYSWRCDKVNTTDPQNRFKWLNADAKTLIKSYYSSRYWNQAYWDTEYDPSDEYGNRYSSLSMSDYFGNVYRLYNLIDMRLAIEDRFGITNIYSAYNEDGFVEIQGSPLSMVLSQNARMEKALKNADDRKFLTDLAVQYGITTADDTSAPEAVLAVYYGIVNNSLSNTNFTYNANKKITREEFDIMMVKFTRGWKALDYANGSTMGIKKNEINNFMYKEYKNCKTFKYMTFGSVLDNPITPLCTYRINGTGHYKYNTSKKRMQSSISKIEVIRMIASAYASQTDKSLPESNYNYSVSNYVKVTDKEMIQVIKKYHLSSNPTKYLKAAKKLKNSGYNLTKTRKDDADYLILNKSKQLDFISLKSLARCDKLGIIKPNSKGKISLYATVTEKEAIKLLTKGAMACKTYYDPYSIEAGY